MLLYLAQHAADAGQGAGREDEVEADFGGGGEFDFPEDDDGRGEEAEVHDDVDGAEDVGDDGRGPADGGYGELARVDLVPHGGGGSALEAGPEEGEQRVSGEEEEEEVVEVAPAPGGHAGQAAVEEGDGDFDDADGGEEDDLAYHSKLWEEMSGTNPNEARNETYPVEDVVLCVGDVPRVLAASTVSDHCNLETWICDCHELRGVSWLYWHRSRRIRTAPGINNQSSAPQRRPDRNKRSPRRTHVTNNMRMPVMYKPIMMSAPLSSYW